MRLDARKGDTGWNLWDVERCIVPKGVVWVDDETAQWGAHDKDSEGAFSYLVLYGEWSLITHQEKRIAIYPDRKLILFNPVADNESQSIAEYFRVPVTVES